jgi:uncharacterized protein (TIGR02453 family)
MTTTSAFSGFRPEALKFLRDLAIHNDRSWFQPRKADYERLLKEPLEELCVALSGEFAARDLPLSSDPRSSPFRIYRDIRFSKDKSPYKTYVSASFPWAGEGSGVGGYFSLSPGNVYVGGGCWHPNTPRLTAWRHTVDEDPAAVHAALGDPGFVKAFGEVEGEQLKRVPPGYASDHPDAELLKLKDVTFGRRFSDKEATARDLPERIADNLAAAMPVFRLLAGLPA